MNIPKTFNIGGLHFSVAYSKNLSTVEGNAGQTHFKKGEVLLAPNANNDPRTRYFIEQTFCHELVHCILISMNEADLNRNEKFVDVFASFLHQALTSQNGKL